MVAKIFIPKYHEPVKYKYRYDIFKYISKYISAIFFLLSIILIYYEKYIDSLGFFLGTSLYLTFIYKLCR